MNNKLSDLNNYLFECLERVNDDELTEEQLNKEIQKADIIQKVAKTIIDNAEVALKAQKHFDEYGTNRNVEIPLLGITNSGLIEENKNLRSRLKKTEQW